jgi:hypothetical protein
MADYIKALEQGFAAARKADRARKEIQGILAKFRDEIMAGTQGKVLIELHDFQEPESSHERMVRLATLENREPKTYQALAAVNPTAEKPIYKVLARWKQSKEGYPCSIILRSEVVQCEDRAALERNLAELLTDPEVGETLYMLAKAE